MKWSKACKYMNRPPVSEENSSYLQCSQTKLKIEYESRTRRDCIKSLGYSY